MSLLGFLRRAESAILQLAPDATEAASVLELCQKAQNGKRVTTGSDVWPHLDVSLLPELWHMPRHFRVVAFVAD